MQGSNLLVRLIGFPALLLHGDPLVLDRWLWLRRRLRSYARRGSVLLDAGSGNGAFTIGAARLGYNATGLTWDDSERRRSEERAALLRVPRARFEIQDLRRLGDRADLRGVSDVVLSLENIEHVLEDEKLARDLGAMVKPGGVLLLTTPNIDYHPINQTDAGPFLPIEDGRHVRKGYSEQGLRDLAAAAALEVREISSCSGFISQKLCAVQRRLGRLHPIAGWVAVLPFRWIPPLLDGVIQRLTGWPDYSICMVAIRPS